MVKVAVAGGTGGIGRHIVEGILETKKHDVVVLSRTPHCPELEALGAKVIAVSYTDPASLEHALAGVHTVISTIAAFDRTGFVESQLALIDAARKAGVTRFAPSEFAIRALHDDPIVLFRMKAEVTDAAKASGMECTLFENGIFMNYLACGTSGIGHLRSSTYIVDVANCKADVPGDGENHLVWTRAEDVGRFVAASLELEAWPEVSSMSGDRKTLNELIKAAESVRGKRFDVTYTPAEDIEKQLSADPAAFFANFHKQTLLEVVRTNRTAYEGANLNRMCPQVKPVGIEEFLKTWWGKA